MASKATGKIGVSIVGLGWPGVEHLKGYRACEDCEVVALCDWDEELLAEVAGEYSVGPERTYTDYTEMIARDDVDAVSLCVPNYEHAELTLTCLAAGKHVPCEKPPAMTAAEARAMADAAEKADRALMYALVVRFSPETRFLKARIDAGELGEIYLAKAGYTRRRGIPLGKDNWFVDKARSGGRLRWAPGGS